MTNEPSDKEKSSKLEKLLGPEETKSLLKKRLIWQHLTQKKVRKTVRAKLKLTNLDD